MFLELSKVFTKNGIKNKTNQKPLLSCEVCEGMFDALSCVCAVWGSRLPLCIIYGPGSNWGGVGAKAGVTITADLGELLHLVH